MPMLGGASNFGGGAMEAFFSLFFFNCLMNSRHLRDSRSYRLKLGTGKALKLFKGE